MLSTLKAKSDALMFYTVAKFEGVLVKHWKVMAVFRLYGNYAANHALTCLRMSMPPDPPRKLGHSGLLSQR